MNLIRAEVEATLRVAVETSNWHFEDQNWMLAEQWHLRAVELQAELDALDASTTAEA